MHSSLSRCLAAFVASALFHASAFADAPVAFLEAHCIHCHDAESKKGGLDLSSLKPEYDKRPSHDLWVRIHDRVLADEMPPKKKPEPKEKAAFLAAVSGELTKIDDNRRKADGRAALRRLNRTEYENTLRDLLHLPGLRVKDLLPEDGRAHGFDKSGEALQLSHVQMGKYLEAADAALTLATAPQTAKPEVFNARLFPGDMYDIKNVLTNGDAVFLKDFKYDEANSYPIIRDKAPKGLGELEKSGVFPYKGAVGVFRHEDDAFMPKFARFGAIYPGLYKLRVSLWSFQWDKGNVLPAERTEQASLMVDGRLIGYYDAPSLKPTVHEVVVWIGTNELIGFNAASLKHIRVSEKKGRAAEYVGPGIAIDWLEVEGPINDAWPAPGHKQLFGDLPFEALPKNATATVPKRLPIRQVRDLPKQPKNVGIVPFQIASQNPESDAKRLLSDFMTKAFRRPVGEADLQRYVGLFQEKMQGKVGFEEALHTVYKAALCSPDFLYLKEKPGQLDDYALASRLSYFLWNSMPDDELTALAAKGKLHEPAVLRQQAERLLADAKSQRFIEHFLDQWLDLREIDLTTPDRKLYPEFYPILRDSMLAETRGFFKELLDKNLGTSNLVQSDFAMLNQRLADLYQIKNVSGAELRPVKLPTESHRGGFLTQACILKITANGTTTSPVKRGAWVLDKILGTPPLPPPPSIPAIEPDTRGVTTIRDQLEKHKADATCAACHRKIDPPGFAMESFDVIGGYRTKYRSLEKGEAVEAWWGGHKIAYKMGLAVDPTGKTEEGRDYRDIDDFRKILLASPEKLARNMARQFAVYATGAEIAFGDRGELDAIVARSKASGYGVKTLILETIQSRLFVEK